VQAAVSDRVVPLRPLGHAGETSAAAPFKASASLCFERPPAHFAGLIGRNPKKPEVGLGVRDVGVRWGGAVEDRADQRKSATDQHDKNNIEVCDLEMI
jgi:hypothetical protein